MLADACRQGSGGGFGEAEEGRADGPEAAAVHWGGIRRQDRHAGRPGIPHEQRWAVCPAPVLPLYCQKNGAP